MDSIKKSFFLLWHLLPAWKNYFFLWLWHRFSCWALLSLFLLILSSCHRRYTSESRNSVPLIFVSPMLSIMPGTQLTSISIRGMNGCWNNIKVQTLVLTKDSWPAIKQLETQTSFRREVRSFQCCFLPGYHQSPKEITLSRKKRAEAEWEWIIWWLIRMNLISKLW